MENGQCGQHGAAVNVISMGVRELDIDHAIVLHQLVEEKNVWVRVFSMKTAKTTSAQVIATWKLENFATIGSKKIADRTEKYGW